MKESLPSLDILCRKENVLYNLFCKIPKLAVKICMYMTTCI